MESARERVIRAAQSLLTEEGIGSLTLSRVISKAGISKGGFFHHFESKEELVRAMFEEGAIGLAEEIAQFRKMGFGQTEAHFKAAFARIRRNSPPSLYEIAAATKDANMCAILRERITDAVKAGVAEGLEYEKVSVAVLVVQGLLAEQILGVDRSEDELSLIEEAVLDVVRR